MRSTTNISTVRSLLFKIFQGAAIGIGFLLVVGSVTYAALGSQVVRTAGIDFIEFFNSDGGKAGMQAEAIHSTRLGTWLPYPPSNENYIRGDTIFNGNFLDENNRWYNMDPSGTSNFNGLCLNGDCQFVWPKSVNSCQFCFKYSSEEDGGQCGRYDPLPAGAGSTCVTIDSWTPTYMDDSDGRRGGCKLQWKLDCSWPYGD